jgi:hypothetical protein
MLAHGCHLNVGQAASDKMSVGGVAMNGSSQSGASAAPVSLGHDKSMYFGH